MKSSRVTLRSPAEIAQAREAGHLAARVLHMITPHVQPGVTTEALDRLCHDYIVNELQVTPANVGYLGYPKTVCTSVNHVICHGIPSPGQVLKAGDIINIDVAIIKDGWFGDTSRMYFVGEPSPLARRLVDTTYEAMCAGIAQVRPGATLGDVGHAIQSVAHRERFSVVREYCGHGIGQIYHDEPQVLHYGQRGPGTAAGGRHGLHHRAHDQRRQARDAGAGRRVDRCHPRPLALCPVGTHGGRDGQRVRGAHALA
ncbi:methionyl aminopeptidase [Acidovorax delafieldii]|nr:methionyl aminopeptidase [Acidovorax delafieldii]